MSKAKAVLAVALTVCVMFACASCGNTGKAPEAEAQNLETEASLGTEEKAQSPETEASSGTEEKAQIPETETYPDSEAEGKSPETEAAPDTEEAAQAEKNGEVYILVTSDVHCGIDNGFGYAGLAQIKQNLESEGYETILVDDGDSIQGAPIGTLSEGETIVKLMNEVGYDIAIPGNHEFDYGMDVFLKLAKEQAEYKYISCNFNYKGSPVFDPYVIKEVCGMKIAFVGVTTPKTLISSSPKNFQDESGEYVYGFLQDDSGEAVYKAVQDAVDSARAEGADFVYVMGHMGLEEECEPWTYADVIANTTGINVFLDGHSHDTDKVVMKNKNGEDVVRCAVGTKLNCIGYSHISADKEIIETDIWSWPNNVSATSLFDIHNDVADAVSAAEKELENELGKVVAKTDVDLLISDPKEKDLSGNPIRMVRRGETNLGDLCTDAFRIQSGADIAICNGGGIRANIEKGDITYGDIVSVQPYGNMMTVIEVTGQQILDALEWGSRAVPEELGGFIQVSGLSYEIDSSVESSCYEDENGMFMGVNGDRRVKNVMVGEEPIDADKKYSMAALDFMILDQGDGFTMFTDSKILQDRVKLDNQVLIDYIINNLGGEIGEEYADPYGQGRIVITE